MWEDEHGFLNQVSFADNHEVETENEQCVSSYCNKQQHLSCLQVQSLSSQHFLRWRVADKGTEFETDHTAPRANLLANSWVANVSCSHNTRILFDGDFQAKSRRIKTRWRRTGGGWALEGGTEILGRTRGKEGCRAEWGMGGDCASDDSSEPVDEHWFLCRRQSLTLPPYAVVVVVVCDHLWHCVAFLPASVTAVTEATSCHSSHWHYLVSQQSLTLSCVTAVTETLQRLTLTVQRTVRLEDESKGGFAKYKHLRRRRMLNFSFFFLFLRI